MPALPHLPVTKILIGIVLLLLALVVGIALGTIVFKITNPNAQINLGPLKAGSSPSPTPPSILNTSPSPQSSPAASTTQVPDSWETYSNEVLGFQFQYPPTAIIEEGDLRGQAIEDSLINDAEYTYGVTANLSEGELVFIASSVNILEEHLPISPKATAEALKESSAIELEFSEVDFAGGTAYRVGSVNGPLLTYFLLSFGRDGENSEISISVIAEKNKESTINQIISSFKFL